MSIQSRSPFFRPFIDNLEEIKQAWRGSTTEEKVKAFAKAIIFIVASALICALVITACRTLLNKAFHIDNAGLTMAVSTVTMLSLCYLSTQLMKHLNEEREAN